MYGDRREEVRVTDDGRSFALTACAPRLADYDAAYISEPGPIIEVDPIHLLDTYQSSPTIRADQRFIGRGPAIQTGQASILR